VQVDPIKPTLKASGTQILKLNHDKLLSSFGFKFNFRRYNQYWNATTMKCVETEYTLEDEKLVILSGLPHDGHELKKRTGRRLHSSTFQLNLSRLVTPPLAPLSNRLGKHHAPNVSHKLCLR